MDIADASFEQEQTYVATELRTVLKSSPPRYEPQGYCLSCYADTQSNQLYCNHLCANDHAKKTKLGVGR